MHKRTKPSKCEVNKLSVESEKIFESEGGKLDGFRDGGSSEDTEQGKENVGHKAKVQRSYNLSVVLSYFFYRKILVDNYYKDPMTRK